MPWDRSNTVWVSVPLLSAKTLELRDGGAALLWAVGTCKQHRWNRGGGGGKMSNPVGLCMVAGVTLHSSGIGDKVVGPDVLWSLMKLGHFGVDMKNVRVILRKRNKELDVRLVNPMREYFKLSSCGVRNITLKTPRHFGGKGWRIMLWRGEKDLISNVDREWTGVSM